MKGGTQKCAATNPGVKQKGYPQYKFSNKPTKQQLTSSNCIKTGHDCSSLGGAPPCCNATCWMGKCQ